MRILYDSRQEKYKLPFGTVRRGEPCILHIHIPEDCGAVGVRLVLEDCEGTPCAEFAFSEESRADGYVIWRAEPTLTERGLYFYWFRVEKADGSFRLFRQGCDTNMEAGEKWQLSVIPEDFTVPDYALGAVVYQILPDRFAKAGQCDLSQKLRPFTVHENWSDTPSFTADAEGNWCSDFFGGNLAGVREKLPYLHELGVNLIYFNPVFMAYSNHRYDTADYKRIDPMLGTEEDFAALCAQAHSLGIRVILDGVFSHTGSNSVYFDAKGVFGGGAVSDPNSPYRAWYRFRRYPDDYESWWNMPTLPNVEELTPSYLDYIIDAEDSVAAHWLRLGADGFRLDVVDELPDAFVLRLKKRLRALKPDAMLIGEVWEDASNKRSYGVSRRYFVDGELDSVMNYPWRKAIVAYVRGEDDGTALSECIMGIAENYPPQVLSCVMNLLGSHDTPRILTLLGDDFRGSKAEQADHRMTPAQYKTAEQRLLTAAFLQFTLPGMASIYYGDEAGMEGFDDPFCRRCYPWGAENRDLRAFFRDLATLKRETPALKSGTVRVTCAGQGRVSFLRTDGVQTAQIFVNRADTPWHLPEDGTLRFGSGLYYNNGSAALQPNGFCLLLKNPSAADGIE